MLRIAAALALAAFACSASRIPSPAAQRRKAEERRVEALDLDGAFSRAMDISRASINRLGTWAIWGLAAFERAIVALYDTPAGRSAGFVPLVRDGARLVPGDGLPLGRADALEPVAVVDLLGLTRRLPYRSDRREEQRLVLPNHARFPAVLARVEIADRRGPEKRVNLLLISLRERRPVLLFNETISLETPSGGFQPAGELRLVRTAPGQPVDITLGRMPLSPPGVAAVGSWYRYLDGLYKKVR